MKSSLRICNIYVLFKKKTWKKSSTHVVSVNSQLNSQHVVVVAVLVVQVAGWPVCTANVWGDIGHLSNPHVTDILNSYLLKTICIIFRNHNYPLKPLGHHEGSFFLQKCRQVAFDNIYTVDRSVILSFQNEMIKAFQKVSLLVKGPFACQ